VNNFIGSAIMSWREFRKSMEIFHAKFPLEYHIRAKSDEKFFNIPKAPYEKHISIRFAFSHFSRAYAPREADV
jgi:hypothetical protein